MPMPSPSDKREQYSSSSSFHMALLFSALLGLAAMALGYIINQHNNMRFIRETEAVIDTEIALFTQLYMHESHYDAALSTKQRLLADNNSYYLLRDAQGNTIGGNIRSWPQHVTLLSEGVLYATLTPGIHLSSKTYDSAITVAAKVTLLSKGRTLVTARDISKLMQSHQHVRLLGYIALIFMFAVVLISYGTSRFVVNKINRISIIARDIMDTGDLSRRINDSDEWDDLGKLSVVLDNMLERLETLVDAVRDVSDNIAHDMRTPLTRLRHLAEELRDHPKDNHKAELLIQETDRLLSIFNAVMRISRIEKGNAGPCTTVISLSDVIEDAHDMYIPFAEDKNIDMSAKAEDVTIHGDRDLLFQAVINLIDNAIKFTPEGGHVVLSCGYDEHNRPFLSVTDSGSGVAEADIDKVSQRFYRTEKSRTLPGNGLGLSMVKAVAEYHKGGLLIENASPGLQVTILFTQ